MTISVLVVDDSSFFRGRISDILKSSPSLTVIGTAQNGQEAIERACSLKPDIITMDYEMPRMDGITAIGSIMQQQPTPILMLSSLSYEGARTTLDALSAGAVDFLPKNFESLSKGDGRANQLLIERVLQIAQTKLNSKMFPGRPLSNITLSEHRNTTTHSQQDVSIRSCEIAPVVKRLASDSSNKNPINAGGIKPVVAPGSKGFKIVAIGASTGGPIAVQNILKELSSSFPVPVLLIQHMPGTFTKAYADRLDRVCEIGVKEAEDGMRLKPGQVYVAPGGKQMMISGGSQSTIRLKEDARLDYKPSVDLTFASLAKAYGNSVLGVVMTGMGSDGTEGARLLDQKGATIWIQDAASCVVNGMPESVRRSGHYHGVVNLDQIASYLTQAMSAVN